MEAFTVCGKTLSPEALTETFSKIFNVAVSDRSIVALGDTWAVVLEGGGFEVSVRCSSEAGGCEVLVRGGDAPLAYCSRECKPDPAAPPGVDTARIVERARRLVEEAGIPLIGSCWGASAE
ncbi:MAG: hypothetical protein F7B17_09365 [Desulfurococcales archaeon]|nr:hypothetical protein [Desulfurococcales archaeon]